MKNILPIKIHPLFYLVGTICFFTGYLKYFIILFCFLFFHELGHISGALFYSWHIQKIVFLPFGGITIFQEKINRPIKEEFVILVLGPIYQIIFYQILHFSFSLPKEVSYLHYFFLLFNLLPIYPLDGSKLIQLLFHTLFSYQKGNQLMIFLSFFLLIFFFFYLFFTPHLFLFLSACFLFKKGIEFYRMLPYMMRKFLLERYQYHFSFQKRCYIQKMKEMKRDYYHFFKTSNGYITEREKLRKIFDFTTFL